jgi:phosphatidyl-myo-inositol alpha-mannosyltransferase
MPCGPLSIAMISHYLPSGSKIGAGYQAHYMANALSRRGHQVTMFSLCGPTEGALYKTETVDAGRSCRTFRLAWALRKIDYSSFDVLHAHGDDYWLWRNGRQRGKPAHIRTMHGSCFAESIHISNVIGKLRMVLLGLSEVVATSVADRTVCVSRNTTRYYPWVRDVIVNGVDLTTFCPAANVPKADVPTILFVGTYHNRKRGRLLMDAFERVVRPAVPSAQLWMVCEGAPAAPGVRVFGRVPLDELVNLYRRAWIFCLPSSYEGFGVPYIEAMACGTPVVATPNVGAVEVLDGGKYGVLTDPKRLGDALVQLLGDSARRTQLTAAGVKRSREYAWDRIVDEYERVYADAVGTLRPVRGKAWRTSGIPVEAGAALNDGENQTAAVRAMLPGGV